MFLAFALAVLLALGLAACGGGGDSSSSQSTATGSSQTSTTTTSGQSKGQSNGGQGSNEKQSGDDNGGSAGGGGSGKGNSGSDDRSAEFRTPGGDNSIQSYGEEADGREIEEVEKAVGGYLGARAKGEWEKSCQSLAKSARAPMEQLAEKSPTLKGKGCGAIIGAFSAQVPASARKSPLVEGIASVRFKGERGFALFHGPKGAAFFIPVVKEGGKWKVGALVASEFP